MNTGKIRVFERRALVGKVRREGGLSLVELMISVTIGILVLGAIFYSYIGSRSSYLLNSEIARLQENGRVVMDMLERDLRMAGYAGCRGASRIRARDATLEAVKANLRVGVHAEQRPGTVLGSEAYSLRIVAPILEAGLTEDLSIGATVAKLAGQNEEVAQVGRYALIYDCGEGELFRIDAVDQSGGGTVLTLDNSASREVLRDTGRAFVLPQNSGGEVGILYDVVDVAAPGGGTIAALTRNGEELLAGVDAINVCLGQGNAYAAEYGESRVADYRRAEAITTDAGREEVVAVQVDLLLASAAATVLENEETQTFSLCGGEVTKTDRRLRKLFSTTVSLRNKLR